MTYKSGELFLTLNKAVEVAVNQFDVDPVIARQEFEQKCYIPCSDYEMGFYDGLAKGRNIIEEAMNEGFDALSALPSAEAVKGEWIDIDYNYRMATCSHCHKVTMFEKWGEYTKPYDFCPNCGAKMKGAEHEVD